MARCQAVISGPSSSFVIEAGSADAARDAAIRMLPNGFRYPDRMGQLEILELELGEEYVVGEFICSIQVGEERYMLRAPTLYLLRYNRQALSNL